MLKVRSLSLLVCTVVVLLAFGAVAQAASLSKSAPIEGQAPGFRVTNESASGDECITQSSNNTTIVANNSVTCNAGGLHTNNGFVRRFELAADHGLSGIVNISSAEVGIEAATAGAGQGGAQPGDINLYSIPIASALTYANMTAVGTANLSIANQNLTLINTSIAASVDADSQHLVFEFFIPSGQSNGNSLFPGSNTSGQIGPSFIAAADCGAPNPTDLALFGFPNVHWVQTVCLGGTPSPALGPLGALLMIVALGGGSAFVMRRRQTVA
jgi:hypothetical protein